MDRHQKMTEKCRFKLLPEWSKWQCSKNHKFSHIITDSCSAL